MSVIMSKGEKLLLKQLRQAADNLGKEFEDHAQHSQERRDALRSARKVALTLANAIEFGGAYNVTSIAQEFDHANRNQKIDV